MIKSIIAIIVMASTFIVYCAVKTGADAEKRYEEMSRKAVE